MSGPDMRIARHHHRPSCRRHARLWPLALLLLGLSGCYERPPPSPLATLPNIVPADPWRAARRAPGIQVTVALPAAVSAKAALIQAQVAIANTNAKPAVLSAPTPCQVADWRIVGPEGKTVAAKRPALCAQVTQSLTLNPGQRLTKTILLPLDPGALRPGGRYRVEFRFWGNPGAAAFRAE